MTLFQMANHLRQVANALEEAGRKQDSNDQYVATQQALVGDLTTQVAALRLAVRKRKRPAAKKAKRRKG